MPHPTFYGKIKDILKYHGFYTKDKYRDMDMVFGELAQDLSTEYKSPETRKIEEKELSI